MSCPHALDTTTGKSWRTGKSPRSTRHWKSKQSSRQPSIQPTSTGSVLARATSSCCPNRRFPKSRSLAFIPASVTFTGRPAPACIVPRASARRHTSRITSVRFSGISTHMMPTVITIVAKMKTDRFATGRMAGTTKTDARLRRALSEGPSRALVRCEQSARVDARTQTPATRTDAAPAACSAQTEEQCPDHLLDQSKSDLMLAGLLAQGASLDIRPSRIVADVTAIQRLHLSWKMRRTSCSRLTVAGIALASGGRPPRRVPFCAPFGTPSRRGTNRVPRRRDAPIEIVRE